MHGIDGRFETGLCNMRAAVQRMRACGIVRWPEGTCDTKQKNRLMRRIRIAASACFGFDPRLLPQRHSHLALSVIESMAIPSTVHCAGAQMTTPKTLSGMTPHS
jgi:hypothetical protein